MNRSSSHPLRARRVALLVTSLLTCLSTVACSAPGSDSVPSEAAVNPTEVSTDLGEEEIELTLYDGAGLKAIDEALIAEFESQHPNVTITTRFDPDDVQAQNAPRVLASDDPPDIARINALSDIVGNNQLTNLDAYAEAYGWGDLPDGQLAMYRVDEDGVRGSGSQYSLASGFVLTGLYYNKELAEQVGVDGPPSTVEELEDDLATAKAAGVTPMIVGNQTGGGTFVVQMMLNNAVGREPINDWVFNVPGADIAGSTTTDAVATVAGWAEQGYFNDDANGTDSTAALGRFIDGEALFFASGSWDAATIQDGMGDDVGFVLPPVGESGAALAMSDPVSNFGIPANADQKDAAAAFLDFLLSPEARSIVAATGAGPSGEGEAPEVEAGTLKAQVQEAFGALVAADGQVQFVQNATSGINADWLSQTQQLLDARVAPQDYLEAIQAAYEEDLR